MTKPSSSAAATPSSSTKKKSSANKKSSACFSAVRSTGSKKKKPAPTSTAVGALKTMTDEFPEDIKYYEMIPQPMCLNCKEKKSPCMTLLKNGGTWPFCCICKLLDSIYCVNNCMGYSCDEGDSSSDYVLPSDYSSSSHDDFSDHEKVVPSNNKMTEIAGLEVKARAMNQELARLQNKLADMSAQIENLKKQP